VAIIGGGFMGRLHLALSRLEGASVIGVVDISEERRLQAREAGADWVAAPEQARPVGGGQDVVFVTAMGGLNLAWDIVNRGGSIGLYSSFAPDAVVPVGADRAHREEISVVGIFNQEPQDWRRASALIRSGVLSDPLEGLISARYPMAQIDQALALVTSLPTYRVFVEGGLTG